MNLHKISLHQHLIHDGKLCVAFLKHCERIYSCLMKLKQHIYELFEEK